MNNHDHRARPIYVMYMNNGAVQLHTRAYCHPDCHRDIQGMHHLMLYIVEHTVMHCRVHTGRPS